jgi:hypothetical protein
VRLHLPCEVSGRGYLPWGGEGRNMKGLPPLRLEVSERLLDETADRL